MPCFCILLAYTGFMIPDSHARTIRFEVDEWRNTSWGFHAIERNHGRGEVAVSADGSRANFLESESFRHFLISNGRTRQRTLYLRARNEGYQIDEEQRTALGGECACTWSLDEAKRADSSCAQLAYRLLESPTRSGDGEIAGQRIVRYRSTDERGTLRELALAPDAVCEVMEWITTYPGSMGLPGGRHHYFVTSYTPGEPDPRVFQIPAGFSIKPRPER